MRAFIALDCTPVSGYLKRVQEQLPAQLKKTHSFHITLKFLGDISERQFGSIDHLLNHISFDPISVQLDTLGVFPKEKRARVVWMGVSPAKPVQELKKQVDDMLAQEFRPDEGFVPHITLARVKKQPIHASDVEHIKAIGTERHSLTFSSLKLIKSTLTPAGPAYEELRSYQAE